MDVLKILIVTWAWPPIGRVGALRPVGMAREWTRAGHEVHVLTGPGDRGGEYAPDLISAAEAAGAVVHRAEAPGIPKPGVLKAAFEMASSERVSRPISRLRQIAGQWRGFPDLQRSWIAPATRRGLDLVSQHRFDVVWSTSPPESVHFVGRNLAGPDRAWVADFRDQWSEYLLGRWDAVSRFVIDRITHRVLSRAAAVTAISDGVVRSLERACGRPVICVRNGFDPVDVFEGKPSGAAGRSLGYFGRVDPIMQHPEHLWPALRARRASGREWTVDFHAAPGGGGGAAVVIPEDLRPSVRELPPLPHPKALQKMQAMTALLVLAWEARGGDAAVAGKLYDYVGSGRPVLVCAPSTFEARRLVERTGTGLGGWGDTELPAALEKLETFVVDPDGRQSLSREAAAVQMLRVFDEIRTRRDPGVPPSSRLPGQDDEVEAEPR